MKCLAATTSHWGSSSLARLVRLGLLAWAVACGGSWAAQAQDSDPPTLVSSVPDDGATGVAPSTTVKFTFNEPMKPQQAIFWIAGTTLLDTNRVVYSWSADGKTLSASYPGGWPGNREVQWTLLPSIEGFPPFFPPIVGFEDLAGNPLDGEASGSFTTSAGGGGPVTVVTTNSCGMMFTNVLKSAFGLTLSALYAQTAANTVVPRPSSGSESPFSFFASASLESPAVATGGTVRTPTGETLPLETFPGSGFLYTLLGSNNLSALRTRFPSGAYRFNLTGASGVPAQVDVALADRNLPTIRVTNFDAAQTVDATKDFVLTWTIQGCAGNDPLTLSIVSTNGQEVLQSPDQECPGALTCSSTSFTIPAGKLQQGQTYQVTLTVATGFSSVDIDPTTGAYAGYSVSTELPLKTGQVGPGPVTPFDLKSLTLVGDALTVRMEPTTVGRKYRLESAPSPQGPWARVDEVTAGGPFVLFQAPANATSHVLFRGVGQ